jgi:hypothetical protein
VLSVDEPLEIDVGHVSPCRRPSAPPVPPSLVASSTA